MQKRFALVFALLATAVPSCLLPPQKSATSVESPYPELGFSATPEYAAPDTLILTFDDGPDPLNTPKILDILKAEQVHAAFFLNTAILERPEAAADGPLFPVKAVVRRIVNEGHEVGNHTVHHPKLSELTEAEIEEEIVGVERDLCEPDVLGSHCKPLSLFRAPFGDPYVHNNPAQPRPEFERVARVVAKHAVEIGWAIDTQDWACPADNGECVFERFKAALSRNERPHGVVLMHSRLSQTAAALKPIIALAREQGYRFGSVEAAVTKQFGRKSSDVVRGAL